ncbi:MAG: glycosyltransferase [Candidatus Eiseniibacteriota bacterium]|nr:MAG: glycosyltransferase [Candidatus Eisenbacteria bacterium]
MATYKTLFLIESLHFGGSEIFLQKLLDQLDTEKFDPLVCCLLEKGSLAPRIEGKGVRVEPLGWQLGSLGSTLRVVGRLARLLREERVQLLQTFFYRPEILGAFAAAMARVPVVIGSQHDVMVPGGRLSRFLLRASRLKVRHVIANCEACRRQRQLLTGLAPESVSVIHIGLSGDEMAAAGEGELPASETDFFEAAPVVLWVGRLLHVKGPDVFLRAAATVLRHNPGARFLVVGDGPMRSELDSLADELGLGGAVRFAGETGTLQGILGSSSVVVCSSRSEGVPTVLMEAMAAGTPVVAPDVGGVGELVRDGVDGLLFESQNSDELASAVSRLLSDKTLAAEIGAAGRQRVVAQFTFDETARRVQALYETLLNASLGQETDTGRGSHPARTEECGGPETDRKSPAPPELPRPLRVLLAVGKGRMAGTERHVLELARALESLEIQISVLVLSEGELVQELRSQGIRVHVLKKRLRYDPLLLLRLVRFFRRHAFDIVHGHPERLVCLGAKLAGVPAVLMTYHLLGSEPSASVEPGRLWVLTERLRTLAVDFTIAVSEADRDALVGKFGRQPGKTKFIANGIRVGPVPSPEKEGVSRELGLSPEARLICTTARLTVQKGMEFLLRAMVEVVAHFPDAVLLVVGTGKLERQLKELCGELNLTPHVRFTGHRKDAVRLVSASELFVLPSLWEGLPYSLLEAMLAAKPVVTTSVCAHVVTDDQTGIVVPPSDARALARAIVRILRDPELASRLGSSGRARLETCFSADRMARETAEVYREVLSGRIAPLP